MDGWLKENIENIMWGIEIAGLIAFAAIFTVYFMVKRKAAQKRAMRTTKTGQ